MIHIESIDLIMEILEIWEKGRKWPNSLFTHRSVHFNKCIIRWECRKWLAGVGGIWPISRFSVEWGFGYSQKSQKNHT